MQFWAFIVDSFRESLDRKIFWVIAAITLVVVLTLLCIGFEADRVTLAFGLWDVETDHFNPASISGRQHIIGVVVYALTYTVLGWMGVILMVIATAGMFPRMLDSGVIDILASKPMSRPKLFLLKYFASMVFVLFHATVFVGLTFLVMGLRWGVWVPGYLLSVFLLVILFSYIFCVSVLVGVKTRSTAAAILISLGAWFLFTAPFNTLQVVEKFPSLKEKTRVYQGLQVARWILPKTAEIPYIAANWAGAGTYIEALPMPVESRGGPSDEDLRLARELEQEELRKNPWVSIGTSLGFEAIIVLWAMGSFARKDY